MPTTHLLIWWIQHLRDLKQESSLFVGILLFMSSWNFLLSWVDHEKSFITLGLVCAFVIGMKQNQVFWFQGSCMKKGWFVKLKYWFNPGRPVLTSVKTCWLGHKNCIKWWMICLDFMYYFTELHLISMALVQENMALVLVNENCSSERLDKQDLMSWNSWRIHWIPMASLIQEKFSFKSKQDCAVRKKIQRILQKWSYTSTIKPV